MPSPIRTRRVGFSRCCRVVLSEGATPAVNQAINTGMLPKLTPSPGDVFEYSPQAIDDSLRFARLLHSSPCGGACHSPRGSGQNFLARARDTRPMLLCCALPTQDRPSSSTTARYALPLGIPCALTRTTRRPTSWPRYVPLAGEPGQISRKPCPGGCPSRDWWMSRRTFASINCKQLFCGKEEVDQPRMARPIRDPWPFEPKPAWCGAPAPSCCP